MNTKKVIGFLLLRPVFTSRNFTSIALVAFFMMIYVLCGGKITVIPKPPVQSSFGALPSPAEGLAASAIPAAAVEPRAERRRSFLGDDALQQVGEQPAKQTLSENIDSKAAPSAVDLSDIKRRLNQLGTSSK